ncbi:MAG: PASTA domain-containing protein [Cytophagales bacterium]|nr:PASTA domain-containing protein [Cytophagales bacterium]
MGTKKSVGFKQLFIHLLIISATACAILIGFFYYYLPEFTHHGEGIEVPKLVGTSYEDAQTLIRKNKLKIKIFDSAYYPTVKPHIIQNQFPEAGEKVKQSRTIYVSVASLTPPRVRMPKLIGYSLKAAQMSLESYGLLQGRIIYIPSATEGAVLKQMVGSSPILPDVWVKKGTKINLVVGNGLGSENMFIPDLSGLNLVEARDILSVNGLELGAVVYDANGTGQIGTVYKQKPEYISGDTTNTIKTGDVIDIWINGENPQQILTPANTAP